MSVIDRCEVRLRIRVARPMARGRKRLSVGPSSACTAAIFSSSPTSSWLCSALATADSSSLSHGLAAARGREGQDGPRLGDVLAADVVAHQPRLAGGGAHVARAGAHEHARLGRAAAVALAPATFVGGLLRRLVGAGGRGLSAPSGLVPSGLRSAFGSGRAWAWPRSPRRRPCRRRSRRRPGLGLGLGLLRAARFGFASAARSAPAFASAASWRPRSASASRLLGGGTHRTRPFESCPR